MGTVGTQIETVMTVLSN